MFEKVCLDHLARRTTEYDLETQVSLGGNTGMSTADSPLPAVSTPGSGPG